MTWWCSATGAPWTWTWQAYPGVWLLVALLALWYWRVALRPEAGAPRPGWLGRRLWFGAGLLSVWVALDWPLGALGAGYLASMHAVSYILLTLVAPPCFILAFPPERLANPAGRFAGLLRGMAQPALGLAVYSVVLLVTHVPAVVDGLMESQAGALAVDLAWMAGGAALWWPVMAPKPWGRLSRPLKMGYLFLSTLPPIIPSAFLTFAEYPLYATYELAPRIFPILTALEDQKVAGLTMKIIGDLPVWFAFGVVFFRWAREEGGRAPVHPGAAAG